MALTTRERLRRLEALEAQAEAERQTAATLMSGDDLFALACEIAYTCALYWADGAWFVATAEFCARADYRAHVETWTGLSFADVEQLAAQCNEWERDAAQMASDRFREYIAGLRACEALVPHGDGLRVRPGTLATDQYGVSTARVPWLSPLVERWNREAR